MVGCIWDCYETSHFSFFKSVTNSSWRYQNKIYRQNRQPRRREGVCVCVFVTDKTTYQEGVCVKPPTKKEGRGVCVCVCVFLLQTKPPTKKVCVCACARTCVKERSIATNHPTEKKLRSKKKRDLTDLTATTVAEASGVRLKPADRNKEMITPKPDSYTNGFETIKISKRTT